MFCCGRSSLAEVRSEKAHATQEAEARHARVASVLSPPPRAYVADRPLSCVEDREAPPPYCAAQSPPNPYSSPSGMNYQQKDEKQALAAATESTTTQTSSTAHQLLSPRDNFAFSDTSSIISIPSTQVTGLDSVYTGRYVRRHSNDRMSDDYSTRPPSYYARSIDRRSSVSSTATAARFVLHPVMREEWLDSLDSQSRNMHDT
ncbi:uncharacterized protein AB675_334 [Cyphellophora attinorum]|uniref:Uncharacterized protein n=1 Tax=Cyphellophora attinorum TaxID=1664694 RepID=A0A0N0NRU7_9EURO|nr:uncharacterized protein AB675_334 [Phialophora attinorum]KPI45508.1 hypothetical protein AB675_334 [Phialophora attinorum]